MSDKEDSQAKDTERIRKMTEKGYQYNVDIKTKTLHSLLSSMFKSMDKIYDAMSEVPIEETVERVRKLYSQWMDEFSQYLEVGQELKKILTLEDLEEFEDKYKTEETKFATFKSVIENYMLTYVKQPPKAPPTAPLTTHTKPASVTGKSKHSVANSLVEEKQKEMELQAKTEALISKHMLEREQLELNMKKEQLDLETKLKVTQAKVKVLKEYEQELSEEDSIQSVNRKFDSCKTNFHDNTAIAKYLMKPTVNICKFAGNAMNYKLFLRQFRTKILPFCDNEDEKLQFLEQFTIGEANDIVRGYCYLDSGSGFSTAMEELDDRYGNEEAIAKAFVDKALKWPPIKFDDVKSLDRFSVFLQECMNAIINLDAVHILEYPDNIKRLVMKLPVNYHDKWRSLVEAKKELSQRIRFSDLAKFVKKEARKVNDPTYGKEALRVDYKIPTNFRPQRFKPKSFAVCVDVPEQKRLSGSRKTDNEQLNRAQPECDFCLKKHHLDSCFKFRAFSIPERLQFLKSHGLCFRCLQRGHISKNCVQSVTCCKCNQRHHSLLHMEERPVTNHDQIQISSRTSDKKSQRQQSFSSTCVQSTNQCGPHKEAGNCTLAIVPVKICMNNAVKVVETYAFLDPGSTVSFCSESLMEKLGGTGKLMEITIDTMGKPHKMKTFAVQGLDVYNIDMNGKVSLPTVYSKDRIPVSRTHVPTTQDLMNWPHLQDITIPVIESEIELLIGNNIPDAYIPTEIRTGPSGSPHATKTVLGWNIWNLMRSEIQEEQPQDLVSMTTQITSLVTESEELKHLHTLLCKSINLDFPERQSEDKREMSEEDKKFETICRESVRLVDGQYELKLPFRGDVRMPDNSQYAKQRLLSLKKKFTRNQEFKEDYNDFVEDILKKGYAEPVPESEANEEGKTWYIPHHGVYHPRKPGKLRVVFDCSAQWEGVSLNSALYRGPDLANNLLGIHLRFRKNKFAIMGDIENMFHRVKVYPEDKNFQRFYWFPDGDCDNEPLVYRMVVHMFGTVSSPSCANFTLRQTFEDNAHLFDQAVVDTAKSSFYVDDFLWSTDTEEDAMNMVSEISKLCSKGGFKLNKWISSSHNVMLEIPDEKRAKSVKSLDLEFEELPSERALGVFWAVESDTLGYRISENSKPNTRRGILSTVSSVYDPLGLISPFILQAKQVLQSMCATSTEWDDEIDGVNLKLWTKWKSDLYALEQIEIPRCYRPENFGAPTSCQLHLFSDASESGYGVVAYLRFTNKNSDIHCSQVMAKSRVAPLKKITTPRLELTAATLAVRLSKFIAENLQMKIDRTVYWTDSMSVLRYIYNENSRFFTFVSSHPRGLQC